MDFVAHAGANSAKENTSKKQTNKIKSVYSTQQNGFQQAKRWIKSGFFVTITKEAYLNMKHDFF